LEKWGKEIVKIIVKIVKEIVKKVNFTIIENQVSAGEKLAARRL